MKNKLFIVILVNIFIINSCWALSAKQLKKLSYETLREKEKQLIATFIQVSDRACGGGPFVTHGIKSLLDQRQCLLKLRNELIIIRNEIRNRNA